MIAATIHGRPIRIRVLCIGTDRYPVKFAEKDASDVAALFGHRYGLPGARVRCLLRPSPAKLRAVLQEIANECPDVFVLFNSGHGGVQGIELANQKLFSYFELRHWIRTIAATHSLIILDTCHSGAFVTVGALSGSVERVRPNFLELLARATPSTRVLCSVAWDRSAGEGIGVNNGHLATALIEAAATAPGNLHGWIDDEELCDLTSRISIERWDQAPVTQGLTGNFPILLAQPPGAGAAPVIGTQFGRDGSLTVSALTMGRAGMPTVIRATIVNCLGGGVATVDHRTVPKSDSETIVATFPVPEHLLIADSTSAAHLRFRGAAQLLWRFAVGDLHGYGFDHGQMPFLWTPHRLVG